MSDTIFIKSTNETTKLNREVTILIADASEDIRSTFELVIGKASDKSLKLIYATTVQEVLAQLEKHEVDLIITDLRLRDGEALVALLKSGKILRVIPIIVLSTYTDLLTKKDLKHLGVAYFFEKPPELSRLQNAIYKCLKIET